MSFSLILACGLASARASFSRRAALIVSARGRKSVDQIDQTIRVHDKLLLMLSKASSASDWVLHEIRRAVDREKREKRQVLFPIGLAPWKDIKAWTAFEGDLGKDLAKVVREYHIPAFSKWKDYDAVEAAFARLLEDLRASEASPATASRATPGPVER